jgi:hypothetical protein
MRSNKWVAREPHAIQYELPFLRISVPIACDPAKNTKQQSPENTAKKTRLNNANLINNQLIIIKKNPWYNISMIKHSMIYK